MGGNGEDSRSHIAGRIRVSKSGQEHAGIHPAGGRPAGPMQVAKGTGQIGLATFESCWISQCPQGTRKIRFKIQLSAMIFNRDMKLQLLFDVELI